MRIAVLSDIHGNLPAFEAVLGDVARQGVDRIVIVGDIVIGAPDSSECWRLARSLGCSIVRGNNERYIAYFGTELGSPAWNTPQYAPLHYAWEQFTADE